LIELETLTAKKIQNVC